MPQLERVLYTGKTRTSGGRDGISRSSDGRLDIRLSPPGSAGQGTNPEQLFAAGWSACFIGAMGRAAQAAGVKLPADVAGDAAGAPAIVDAAHQLCPYSKATRGNIAVELTLA